MPRINSEIKEQFLKIADNCGLTKMAEEDESAELKKYKEDPEARMGSDDFKTIEVMYGVKPDSSIEYTDCIMEAAHPNSVIIAPSYDKINGLVENEMERANISRNIVQKPPTGNHTNHKYAHHELVMELVRIANEMDARNKEELFKLADSCLVDLSARQRQLKKEAVPVLAIIGIAAAVLGAGWLASHTNNVDHGPLGNIDIALKALADLKTNSWYESNIDSTVEQEVDLLIKYITQLKQAVIKFNKVSDLIYKPKTLSELKELVKLKDTAEMHGDEIASSVREFKDTVLELEPLLTQAIENFSDTAYQKQHTKPSRIGEMAGWLGEALHGRWGLIANDFISAVNALNPLKTSIEEMTHRLENMDKVVDKYKSDIQSASAKLEEKPKSDDLHGFDGEEFFKHIME